MRIRMRFFSGIAVVFLLMFAGAPAAFSQSELVRWDIISLAFATPPATANTLTAGGVAFAKALDGSKIKLTGSGTFLSAAGRVGGSGPVTGGGTWETFNPIGVSLANGTYVVTELLIYEFANYQLPVNIDNIGNIAEGANGIAALRIDYSDGSKGVLLVLCHGPGAPAGISEGFVATKAFRVFDQVQAPLANVNENRTVFHRAPILITGLTLPTTASRGASFSATVSGPNLTAQTYFDVRFRIPGSTVDQVASNWQTGTSGTHTIPVGTAAGIWTVTGVRAHQDQTDHTGSFTTVSVVFTVTP